MRKALLSTPRRASGMSRFCSIIQKSKYSFGTQLCAPLQDVLRNWIKNLMSVHRPILDAKIFCRKLKVIFVVLCLPKQPPRVQWDILDKVQMAAEEVGIPRMKHFNRSDSEGSGYFQVRSQQPLDSAVNKKKSDTFISQLLKYSFDSRRATFHTWVRDF